MDEDILEVGSRVAAGTFAEGRDEFHSASPELHSAVSPVPRARR